MLPIHDSHDSCSHINIHNSIDTILYVSRCIYQFTCRAKQNIVDVLFPFHTCNRYSIYQGQN